MATAPPGMRDSRVIREPEQRQREARRGQGQARLTGLLLIATLVCRELDFPLRAAGVGFGVWAIVTASRSVGALRRAGAPGNTRGFAVLGLVMACVLTTLHVGLLATQPLTADYEQCLRGANTLDAQRVCDQDFQKRVDDLTRLSNFGSKG